MADKNMMLNAFLTRIQHLEGDDECLEPIKPALTTLSNDVLSHTDTPDNAFLLSRFEHCMNEINAFEDLIETVGSPERRRLPGSLARRLVGAIDPACPRSLDTITSQASHSRTQAYATHSQTQSSPTRPTQLPYDPRFPPAHRHDHPGHLRHASNTPSPGRHLRLVEPPARRTAGNHAGAIAFLNLPSDGTYPIRVQASLTNEEGSVYLRVPSGQVFIESGEDTTGGGLEPDSSDVNQGQFITLDKGTYCMRYKGEAGIVHLAFSPSTTCCNHLTDTIRLPMPH